MAQVLNEFVQVAELGLSRSLTLSPTEYQKLKDATLSSSSLHNGETGDWREAIEQALERLA
jgi:hypothetical protein